MTQTLHMTELNSPSSFLGNGLFWNGTTKDFKWVSVQKHLIIYCYLFNHYYCKDKYFYYKSCTLYNTAEVKIAISTVFVDTLSFPYYTNSSWIKMFLLLVLLKQICFYYRRMRKSVNPKSAHLYSIIYRKD